MKPNHFRIFLHAFRTAVLIVAGFIVYEILLRLEKMWNRLYPNAHMYNFAKRKTYKFITIFLIDLLILYLFVYAFNIEI